MDSDKLGGMFQKYLLFSPNIFVDPQYKALIDYVEKETGQKKEDFCFEDFDFRLSYNDPRFTTVLLYFCLYISKTSRDSKFSRVNSLWTNDHLLISTFIFRWYNLVSIKELKIVQNDQLLVYFTAVFLNSYFFIFIYRFMILC